MERKVSLKELSSQLNIPASTIHGWLNGVPPKNIKDVKRLADFFGVSIEELCFATNTENLNQLRDSVLADLGNYQIILRQKERVSEE